MCRRVEVFNLADQLRAHLHARRKRRERETRMARNQAGPIIPHGLPDPRDDARSADDHPVQAKLALAARSPSTVRMRSETVLASISKFALNGISTSNFS